MRTADVFVLTGLDGKLLDPAIQATVLAKYSRSPDSARDLVAGVTPEDAAAFQEKWGVKYGHSSIAELCTMPYCFEGVSIIASKALEKYQRPGYSEKSTRYQVFSEDSFIEPVGAPPELRETAEVLYRTYKELDAPLLEHVAGLVGGAPIEELMKRTPVKGRAFDSLRYLLPAGTGTNLAAVVNARDARYMMSDLLGSPLPELKDLGGRMVKAAKAFAPVFAMGAKENSFEPPVRSLGVMPPMKPGPGVRLVEPRYRATANGEGFWQKVRDWYGMSADEFAAFMETRGARQVPDVFKTISCTFELLMDYGAFRDLQRHRRCEQYIEPLGFSYGYVVPDDIEGTRFEAPYRRAMDVAQAAWHRMIAQGVSPNMAQYAVPLGALHRSHFQMDLREVYYIGEVRTQPQGHISYRRIAWDIVEEARWAYPTQMQWCCAIKPDTIGEHH